APTGPPKETGRLPLRPTCGQTDRLSPGRRHDSALGVLGHVAEAYPTGSASGTGSDTNGNRRRCRLLVCPAPRAQPNPSPRNQMAQARGPLFLLDVGRALVGAFAPTEVSYFLS